MSISKQKEHIGNNFRYSEHLCQHHVYVLQTKIKRDQCIYQYKIKRDQCIHQYKLKEINVSDINFGYAPTSE